MSQAATRTSDLGPKNPPRSTAAPQMENRETLLSYLQMAARVMRRNELSYGILMWLTLILFSLTAVVLVDHWLWEFNALARYTIFAVLLLWTLLWIPRYILPPLAHPINIEHAARTIEKQFPECKDSLISWLQLSTIPTQTAPKGVVSYVGRYAIRNLKGQDAVSVVDSATVVRLGAAFFGCLLCGVIYLIASPKSGFTSIARMVAPWADIAPAARVQFIEIIPGASTVTTGSSMPMSVTVRGMHQGEGVRIRYDLSDGQRIGETIPMVPEIEGISYKLDFGKSFGGIHQPLTYWVLAGDGISGPYEVKVQVVPLVAIERVELKFPAYTKLKSRSLLQQGSFEAPEGTAVELIATTNQTMKKARLEFDPVLQQKMFVRARDLIDLNIDQNRLIGKWTALLDDAKSNPTVTSYRIKATNELDETNPDPILYQIKVIADLAPEVSLDSELPAQIDVPFDGQLDLELRASDPDYGLTQLTAVGFEANPLDVKNRQELLREVCFESEDGAAGTVSRVFTLRPADLNVKPGDVFDFIAVATDNRHDPSTSESHPNVTETSPIRIRVTAPQATKQPAQNEAAANGQPLPQPQPPREDPKRKPDLKITPKGANTPPDKSASDNNRSQPDAPQDPADANSKTNPPPSQPKDNSQQRPNDSSPKDASSDPKQGQDSGDSQGDGQGQAGGEGDSKDSGSSSGSSGNSKGSGKANGQSTSNDGPSDGAQSDADNSASGTPQNSATSNGSKSNGSSQNSNDASVDPPTHDGDAFDRIEQFRQEQENPRTADPNTQSDPNQRAAPQGDTSETSDATSIDDKDAENTGLDNKSKGQAGSTRVGNDPQRKPNQGDAGQGSEPMSKANDPNGKNGSGQDPRSNSQTGSMAQEPDANSTGNAGGNQKSSNTKGSNPKGGDPDPKERDPKGSDSKGSDSKGSDPKGSDPKGSDPKGSDSKGSDSKGSDSKGSDPKGGDSKGGDSKGSDPKGSDPKGGDSKGSDPKVSDPKGSDPKGGDPKGGDSKGNDPKGSDPKGGDSKGVASDGGKPNENQPQTDDRSTGDGQGDGAQGEKPQSNVAQSNNGKDAQGKDAQGNDSQPGEPGSNTSKGSDPKGKDPKGAEAQGDNKPTDNAQNQNEQESGAPGGKGQTGKDPGAGSQGNKPDGKEQNGQPGQKDGSSAGKESAAGTGSKDPAGNGATEKSPSPSTDGQPQDGGGAEGAADGPPSDASNDKGDPTTPGSGPNRSGKTPRGGGASTSRSNQPSPNFGEEKANLEYAEKTTDLLLDYIDRQRDAPDPELLKRLDWNADDLRKFADRWRSAKEQARLTPEKRAEFEASLRSLGLRQADRKVDRLKDRDDALKGMQEQGTRLRPPESLREQFEAFRRAAGKLNKSP